MKFTVNSHIRFRFRALFIILCLAFSSYAKSVVRVIDADSSDAIPYATVFSSHGVIIGLTDDNGIITINEAEKFPITIKCMGYEPLQCDAGVTTARLIPSVFSLNELVVSPADRPVTHIVCYIREYVSGETGPTSVIMFNEHMGDFFVTDQKVKGFKSMESPRFLSSRLHTRITDSESGIDSIFKPQYRNDMISWEQLITFPSGRVEFKADTVLGKHSVRQIVRRGGELATIRTDYLADSKDHSISPMIFKLLGFTMDITEFQSTMVVQPSEPDSYKAADILSATFSFDITGRGKWIKKAFKTDNPVRMYGYYEIYPVEIEHLTVEDAKELQKNPPKVKMQVSPLATAPEPAAQLMIDRCGQ